jgi:hypothetical protein
MFDQTTSEESSIVAYAIIVYQYIHNLSNNFSSCCCREKHPIYTEKSKIMNRTTTVVVALIAAAGLSTMAYAVPEQRALAWGGLVKKSRHLFAEGMKRIERILYDNNDKVTPNTTEKRYL